MRNSLLLCVSAAMLLVVAAGCGPVFALAQPKMASVRRAEMPARAGEAAGQVGGEAALTAKGEPSPHLSVIQPRKVVYTGNFRLVAGDVNAALAATKSLADKLGGYMQRMTASQIVIRVPAGRFYDAVAALEKLGTVIQKDIAAQDVTDEHVDLELRLRNARALRDKFEELLKRAATVKEALAVETELARVREQIERLAGQLKRLNSRIAFATLAVTFVKAQAAPEEVKVRLPFWWLRTLGVENLLAF